MSEGKDEHKKDGADCHVGIFAGQSLRPWEENEIDNFNKLEYVKRVKFYIAPIFVAIARPFPFGRDTQSCSAEQGNQVKNLNTVQRFFLHCAVSMECILFLRKQVIGAKLRRRRMDVGGQPPEHISQKTYKQVRTEYESIWSFVHTMKAAFQPLFCCESGCFYVRFFFLPAKCRSF